MPLIFSSTSLNRSFIHYDTNNDKLEDAFDMSVINKEKITLISHVNSWNTDVLIDFS